MLGFFAFCPAEQKEIKSGEDQVGLEEEGGGKAREQFLPVIPPKLERGTEGRAEVGLGNLGCGLVTEWHSCRGGGYEKRRQPDSSLNCRGLAASSWCEGLECGRPAQAYQAHAKASQRQGQLPLQHFQS